MVLRNRLVEPGALGKGWDRPSSPFPSWREAVRLVSFHSGVFGFAFGGAAVAGAGTEFSGAGLAVGG